VKAGAQGSRFGILLNRIFGLGNQDMPVDVAPETLPVFDVASGRFENLTPRGEIPVGAIAPGQAAVVAEWQYNFAINEAGSRHCLVIERISSSAANQGFISLLSNASGLTATVKLGSHDGRKALLFGLAAIGVGSASSAALPGTTYKGSQIFLKTYSTTLLPRVLPPGWTLLITGNAQNVTVPVLNFEGYVRPCDPEEMRV